MVETASTADRPVGIFDSGLGGLTVLSAVRKRLPSENIIYFGDTARVPYGSKSRDTVRHYSLEILEFLQSKNVKAVVVACNTASAHAFDLIEQKAEIPVLGVIEPGVNGLPAGIERAAVIATRSTVRSAAYEQTAALIRPGLDLYSKACPLFVPLIEEGFINRKATELIVREYLDEIDREEIRDIILGCTHYPLLKQVITRLYPGFNLVDSSDRAALELEALVEKHSLRRSQAGEGRVEIFVSDITDSLLELEKLFLGGRIHSMNRVNLNW